MKVMHSDAILGYLIFNSTARKKKLADGHCAAGLCSTSVKREVPGKILKIHFYVQTFLQLEKENYRGAVSFLKTRRH